VARSDAQRERGLRAVVSQGDVRQAIDAGEFVLHYQPIVDLASDAACGVEALLRWADPSGGLVPPGEFLPAIVHTPVMSALTRWVLRAASAAAVAWPAWTVSVNVTARDVVRAAFVDEVTEAMSEAGLPPDRLIVELTETALVQDLPRAAATLTRLRALGVGVALDDFGTGYSSMLYLRDLPVTSIKIDQAFTSGVERSDDDRAIVTSLLELAGATGLTAVAEGVERAGQLRTLRALGCPMAQGHLWSEAVPEADLRTAYRHRGSGLAAGRPRARPGRPVDARVEERVADLLAQGASLHTIAAALNAAGLRTDRGTRWQSTTVAYVIRDRRRGQPPG